MFRKAVETIVGGAIGLIALYAVAMVAYSAGQAVAKEEQRHNEAVGKEVEVPDQKIPPEENSRKVGKLGLLWGLRRMAGKGKRESGSLFDSFEGHQLEASVNEGEVHIDIRKKEPSSREKKHTNLRNIEG